MASEMDASVLREKFYDLQAGHVKKTKIVHCVPMKLLRISVSLMDLNTSLSNLFW